VTAFLLGCGAELEVPSPVCVAYSRAAINGRTADGSDKSGTVRVKEIMAKVCVAVSNAYFAVIQNFVDTSSAALNFLSDSAEACRRMWGRLGCRR
jgi:hypothetical protein